MLSDPCAFDAISGTIVQTCLYNEHEMFLKLSIRYTYVEY